MNHVVTSEQIRALRGVSVANGAVKRVEPEGEARSYKELIANASMSDWLLSGISLDAETFQNIFSLRAAVRDAYRCNPYLMKYQEHAAANIFGENGILLRMKIKETEDRVVYAAEEKNALIAHERKINELIEWAERRTNTSIPKWRAYALADHMERSKPEDILRGEAMIKIGQSDVYANTAIENAWMEWQRPEFCDVRGTRHYNVLRQLRLWSAMRDGDCFLRMIADPSVNKFGFALQIINAEWCDYFLNQRKEQSGSVIRMGIEWEMREWGLGKPTGYYFIKRLPDDWRWTRLGGWHSYTEGVTHLKLSPDEIIHYARDMDADSTRPAPWGVGCLPKVRHLDNYEIAEVIAARAEACKVGFLYSDAIPEGGIPNNIDPAKSAARISLKPGSIYGLEWGVKYQSNDPTHPTGDFAAFREGMGQAASAALPGADYNVIFNDLKNINFSAGRLGRLDTNEINKGLQRFDIEKAERRIFEEWLRMALLTGAVPLPSTPAKYRKFNKPQFQGRRWAQVDEGKAVDAAAKRVALMISSLNRECAEEGLDFEENAFERAEEFMLLEKLGLPTSPNAPTWEMSQDGAGKPDDDTEPKKPAKEKRALLNGVNGHTSDHAEENSRL